jgi:hypothetical protein
MSADDRKNEDAEFENAHVFEKNSKNKNKFPPKPTKAPYESTGKVCKLA